MFDVIIVEGGPAGFTAALYAARAKLNTLLIEKKFSGGQMALTNLMENYPGFDKHISGVELAKNMENQAKHFGAKINNENIIEQSLDSPIKIIKTESNIYQSKAVILCMVAYPRALGLPNEERFINVGISYCATCDRAFFQDRVVAVVGGGDTAAEDCIYLSRICTKVYLIHMSHSA
jgi:thioredoxin reductase (NADPH)